jgi:protein subunit release factor A
MLTPCKLNNSFKRIKVYLYDRADFSSYREQLSQVNFDNLFASDDIDSITRSIVQMKQTKQYRTIKSPSTCKGGIDRLSVES